MPNAKDFGALAQQKFLVLGKIGSGKTAGFLTLPGKKFTYCFDPNSILTLRGQDVEFEEFLPEDLSMKVMSLSKDTVKKTIASKRPKSDAGANLYYRWEKDFEERMRDGFFDPFDWIGFDSFTTLADMVMDTVLSVNGRAGQWPVLADYGPQMLSLTNIIRTATSLGKGVYFTGHLETRQDEVTSRIVNQPMMTGRLRTKLPLLFSEVLPLSASTDMKGKTIFNMQTRPDRYHEDVRCSLRNAKFMEDVTIDWSKPMEGQGIGRLYR